MKYVVYDEAGLGLQDSNFRIYKAKDPEKMLAKLFFEELKIHVNEDELEDLQGTIALAFVCDEWDGIDEEGTFTGKDETNVEYMLSSSVATISVDDLYGTSMRFSIVEDEKIDEDAEDFYDCLLPSKDEMIDYIADNWNELELGEKMSREEAATYLGDTYDIDSMDDGEINDAVSELQCEYYTSGEASSDEIKKRYKEMVALMKNNL